ncbi:MAG TPA: alpha/beta hydrolase [Candidatus Saccharimonadales bacterium]|nr:alpha/beta hydrolase [Candidatus Saccharimonadales bacterium]
MCKVTEHPITHREHKHSVVMTESIHHRRGGHVLMATALPKRPEFDKAPVLICNGYGAGIGAMGRLATVLAEQEGRAVITYDELRSRAAWADPVSFRSETILSVMDRFDKDAGDYFSRPTLVGWSTGGPAAIGVAEYLLKNDEQERLGAVIPTASAGIGQQASEIELTVRAGLEIARGFRSPKVICALGAKAAQGFAGYLCRDIILSAREVGALSNLNMSERLADVDRAGVPLRIIAMTEDIIFPINKMTAAVEQIGLGHKLRSINGSHINLAWQPRVIKDVVNVIEEAEAVNPTTSAA